MKNRNGPPKRWNPLLTATVALVVTTATNAAWATTRTIQFAGIANSRATTAFINNENVRNMYCTVVVVNTGGSAQKITSAGFTSYNATSGGTDFNVSGNNYIIGTTLSGTSTSGTQSDCTTGNIQPGGMCVFHRRIEPIPWEDRIGVCAGKLVVADVDASTPGSVTASGSITTTQEMMVMGGVLSAALYDNGPPIIKDEYENYASPAAINYTVNTITMDTYVSQMNYNCAIACAKKQDADGKSWGYDICSRHCGANYQLPTTSYSKKRCYLSSGTNTCPDSAGSTFTSTDEERLNTMTGFVENMEPALASLPSENKGYGNGHIINIRTPNSIYAGGMVHELSIGPFTSICSANLPYSTEGGTYMEHDAAYEAVVHVATDTDNNTNTAGGKPWEMLYCAHRHRQTDLFQRVGHDSPFVINGGMPF